MALWNEQYKVGNAVIHAIDCSRWQPEGRNLRMNPTLKEIDQIFSAYRKSLKRMQRHRLLKKDGNLYIPSYERLHDSFSVIPVYGNRAYSFRLSDIVYAKWVMKNHRDLFPKLKNWNNLELLINLLKRAKVKKPKLTAQLIFAAWCHDAP